MKELGEYLRVTRLDNGVSLEEASEHTSKISLDDILEAKKKSEEKEEKKIKSPYTKEYKKKINPLPIIILVVSIVAVCVLVYMIVTTIRKAPARTEELRGIIYEFTNETYCS